MGYKPVIIFICILSLASCILAQTTFDPSIIGVGARAMGMGKAYVAVGEEADTLFSNPAGLGEIDTFQFTSMSGKLLEDVNYTMLGISYPMGNRTALGIGYISANITGIELRDSDGKFLNRSDFGNSTLFLSLGKKFDKRYSLGINLKFFNQNGTENSNGNGTGTNLDIGVLQKGLGPFSLGITAQNILNNKIRFNSGQEEAVERVLKVGTKVYLTGERYGAARLSPIEINYILDGYFSLENSKPTTTHTGFELSPNRILTFRAGLDQNDLTYGLTLKLAGVGLHYAYHSYTQNNATYYLSINFDELGWPYEGPQDIFLGSR